MYKFKLSYVVNGIEYLKYGYSHSFLEKYASFQLGLCPKDYEITEI